MRLVMHTVLIGLVLWALAIGFWGTVAVVAL